MKPSNVTAVIFLIKSAIKSCDNNNCGAKCNEALYAALSLFKEN